MFARSCHEPAAYKIAARWSDGRLAELKTYGFACSDHLGDVFRESLDRQQHYVPGPGETVEELAIYRYEPGNATVSYNGVGVGKEYRS